MRVLETPPAGLQAPKKKKPLDRGEKKIGGHCTRLLQRILLEPAFEHGKKAAALTRSSESCKDFSLNLKT